MEIKKCEKCSGIMAKSGVMDSGNSKFDKFTCKDCGHTTMKCVGVNN